MQPKLQEHPKEWLKFTLVMALALMVVGFILFRRQWLSAEVLFWFYLGLGIAVAACAIRPRWFRGFYRAGMTASFHLGQFMGKLMLTLIFWTVITPLGLWLRMRGKDLLKLRRNPAATSYWHPAKNTQEFDRMF